MALTQEDLPQAKAHTEECLSYIAEHSVAGIGYPIVVCCTCARILATCGEPERARKMLEAGYALLTERAAKISDPALQRSFLENVPAHRELLREWKSSKGLIMREASLAPCMIKAVCENRQAKGTVIQENATSTNTSPLQLEQRRTIHDRLAQGNQRMS